MDKHDIPFLGDFYTKTEVDAMVAAAVEEARAIDEASMAEHNFKATIISMILGFICLALFLDGTLRLLGIIPPFLDIDISIVDKIAEKVETEGEKWWCDFFPTPVRQIFGTTLALAVRVRARPAFVRREYCRFPVSCSRRSVACTSPGPETSWFPWPRYRNRAVVAC